MTPKDKAKELEDKMWNEIDWATTAKPIIKRKVAKECLLICIKGMNEILDSEGYDDDDYNVITSYLEEMEKQIKKDEDYGASFGMGY